MGLVPTKCQFTELRNFTEEQAVNMKDKKCHRGLFLSVFTR